MTGDHRRKRARESSRIKPGTASQKRARHPPQATESTSHHEDVRIQIHAIANRNWIRVSSVSNSKDSLCSPNNVSVVSDIYRNYLCSVTPDHALAALVETHYFESMLWPVYCGCVNVRTNENASVPLHDILSSVMAVFVHGQRRNPELAQRFLSCFDRDEEAFATLCQSLLEKPTYSRSYQERCLRTSFLTEMFRLIDRSCIRDALGPFVTVSLWVHLSRKALQEQARNFPILRKQVRRIARRAEKRDMKTSSLHEDGLFHLLAELECEIDILSRNPSESALQAAGGTLTLFGELLSRPRSRIFVLPILEDRSTLPLIQGLNFALAEECPNISPVAWTIWMSEVDWFSYFVTLPYDTVTGNVIPRDELRDKHSKILLTLQSTVHASSRKRKLPSDHSLSFVPQTAQRTLRKGSTLRSAFMQCEDAVLDDIRKSLELAHFNELKQAETGTRASKEHVNQAFSRTALVGAITYLCSAAEDPLEKFRNSPMMISEGDLSTVERRTRSIFASTRMPCVNAEFLNIQDYLLRNFVLYKAEAATVIFKNLQATLSQMQPCWNGETYEFAGQSDVALPIGSSEITTTGFVVQGLSPSMNVKLQITVSFARCSNRVRREWEGVQNQSVMFLVKLGSSDVRDSTVNRRKETGDENVGHDRLTTLISNSKIRGFLLEEKKAHDNNAKKGQSNERVFTGFLDSMQFTLDSQHVQDAEESKLHDFDLIVRSSNTSEQIRVFPLLSALRESLLSEEPSLPVWLEDLLVGRQVGRNPEISTDVNDEDSLDFADTFLSEDHLKSSFPGAEVTVVKSGVNSPNDRTLYHLRILETESSFSVEAEAYDVKTLRSNLCSRQDSDIVERAANRIEFDRFQIDAIRSGMKHGLTLLEGPPGSGKTSCVVQIATNLFHGAANERVLIITRSKQALKEVVGRLLSEMVDPLRILKLTDGASTFAGEAMSPDERINSLLERRLHLLSEVARLAACCVKAGHSASADEWNCELADRFYQTVVREKWQKFMEATDQSWDQFPFKAFFSEEDKVNGEREGAASLAAEEQTHDPLVSYSAIASLFADVEELRFLEVMRHWKQRKSYVLTTYSRLVAMTGTYAASHRDELIAEGFSYDTLIVEEATASLEVETFLSMVLQKRSVFGQTDRLKRITLVGNQRQVPEIHNEELRNVCNLRQSMFSRLIRLGNKVVHLSQQGRSRKSIANLIRLQYPTLEDRKHVSSDSRFIHANPGFAYTTQFIDTGDSDSESEQTATGFQNIVEAEFIAFVYIYMRLLGYPSEKIAVLTMYDSQVLLLKDTIRSRLAQFPRVKGVCHISTVDDFQGREADYVLVSLVRTTNLRKATDDQDVTNAISRARLGVYIFGYLSRFESIVDFKRLIETLPSSRRLQLVATETFTDCDRSENDNVHQSLPTREVHSPADMAGIVSHFYTAVTASS